MTVQDLTARHAGQRVIIQDWSTRVEGELHKFDLVWVGGMSSGNTTHTPVELASVRLLIGQITVEVPVDATVELLGPARATFGC